MAMKHAERHRTLASIEGPALDFMTRLDEVLCSWSAALGGQPRVYSPLLPVDKLHQSDHFSSFPHQATFAVSAAAEADNLKTFASDPVDGDGFLKTPALNPVRYCLTPGACYPIYLDLENQHLDEPLYLTVRSVCFRHETVTEALRRQPAFNMREIVCLGTSNEVSEFLAALRPRVEALCAALGLDVTLQPATDPFFEPKHNSSYITQKLSMLKLEMQYQGDLAIGSINDHRQGFGTKFDIARGAEPAHSACVAFGLERWLYCMYDAHGPDAEAWPVAAADVSP